jgi:hypothetical protein
VPEANSPASCFLLLHAVAAPSKLIDVPARKFQRDFDMYPLKNCNHGTDVGIATRKTLMSGAAMALRQAPIVHGSLKNSMTGIHNIAIPTRDRLTRNLAHEGTRRKHGSSGMNRANDPLIVLAEDGIFSKNYQYLMSYKGIAFFTKSGTPLPLPGGAELVTAGRIWVPGS